MEALGKCKAANDSNQSITDNSPITVPNNLIEPNSRGRFNDLVELLQEIFAINPIELCSFISGSKLSDQSFAQYQSIIRQTKYNLLNKPSFDLKTTTLVTVIFTNQDISDNQETFREFLLKVNQITNNQLFVKCDSIQAQPLTSLDLDCVPNTVLDSYFNNSDERTKYSDLLKESLNSIMSGDGVNNGVTNKINNSAVIETDADTLNSLDQGIKNLLNLSNLLIVNNYNAVSSELQQDKYQKTLVDVLLPELQIETFQNKINFNGAMPDSVTFETTEIKQPQPKWSIDLFDRCKLSTIARNTYSS